MINFIDGGFPAWRRHSVGRAQFLSPWRTPLGGADHFIMQSGRDERPGNPAPPSS